MAKSKDTSEAKPQSTPTPTLTIKQFLGTVVINERDKWVVEKIYSNNESEKTGSEWFKELNNTCKGITINKITP